MKIHSSYSSAYYACMDMQTYSVAHLNKLYKNTHIDTSCCYKIFLCLSGNKKFHINEYTYDVNMGEIFFVNPFHFHYFSHFDESADHDRYVIFIYPNYLKKSSTSNTNLANCFSDNLTPHHNFLLNSQEISQFTQFIDKIVLQIRFGDDLLNHTLFCELMVFLNRLAIQHHSDEHFSCTPTTKLDKKITDIFAYIDEHITDDICIDELAKLLHISPSYLCKIYKSSTGTTIHKYITAKRITLAKHYLSEGYPIAVVSRMCGYNDYNVFLKAFTKETGLSPKKYTSFLS